jgi:hypothetical protein
MAGDLRSLFPGGSCVPAPKFEWRYARGVKVGGIFALIGATIGGILYRPWDTPRAWPIY